MQTIYNFFRILKFETKHGLAMFPFAFALHELIIYEAFRSVVNCTCIVLRFYSNNAVRISTPN